MPHLRITLMDSQRYDVSNRRQPSCLPVATLTNAAGDQSLALSAQEGLPSPQYPKEPWANNLTGKITTPSGRTSISENTSDTRNPSRTSLVESCTSTLSGDMSSGSPKKSARTPSAQYPSLRKSKSSVGRIFCGLDCTRSSTVTSYIIRDVDDDFSSTNGEKDDEQTIGGIAAQHAHDVKRDNKRVPLPSPSHPHPPLFRPGNEVCFTDTFVHEDGYATTRTIIRPRCRSRSRSSKPQLGAPTSRNGTGVRGGLARMRSLDCLRGSNNFEDELDSMVIHQNLQKHARQHQQPTMRLRVYEERTAVAEEKWRSVVQDMLYQNPRPVHSIESRIEVE